MRTTLALVALATGCLLFTPALAQPPGPSPAPGPQMSVPDIIRALEGQGYRDFRKIERERGLYEVKALDGQGRLFKLYVDGATGQVLAQQERRLKLDDDD
jgi:hypothetical protein